MKYPCENCKLRAAYESTSVPAGEATLSRCHLRNRKSFARSMIFGSINNFNLIGI